MGTGRVSDSLSLFFSGGGRMPAGRRMMARNREDLYSSSYYHRLTWETSSRSILGGLSRVSETLPQDFCRSAPFSSAPTAYLGTLGRD